MKQLFLDKQFHRFIVVGILNTIVSYSLFAFFIYIGLHYVFASLFATILGVLFNFHTIGKLVFKQHNYQRIFYFFGVYSITYFLSIIFLYFFDKFNVDMYLAGFLLLGPMAIISFLLNRYYVFNQKDI